MIENEFWVTYPDHLNYFSPESIKSILHECNFQSIAMIADFPIDLFLFNPNSNYINNPKTGKAAHRARIKIENLLHAHRSTGEIFEYYEKMSNLGIGREIISFAKKQS